MQNPVEKNADKATAKTHAPKIICNISRFPKPHLPPTKDHRPVTVTGQERKNTGGRPRTYTKAQDAIIKDMRSKGASYKQIGEQIGRTGEAVRRRWYRLEGFA